MCRKNKCLTKSRLREYMRKYTENEHLLDVCMRAAISLVGFESVDEEDFFKEDRAFMKRVKRIPNELIDNCSIWYKYTFAKTEGPMIIKKVKEDLRRLV